MDLYRNVASQFIEENPEFSIEVQSLAGSYQEKLYSALAAGTGPNMIKMATLVRMHLMRQEDLLLEFPEDIFPPSWFEEAYPLFDTKTNGRYVLPTGTTCTLLMYNKEMFAEAGLDPESPPPHLGRLCGGGQSDHNAGFQRHHHPGRHHRHR